MGRGDSVDGFCAEAMVAGPHPVTCGPGVILEAACVAGRGGVSCHWGDPPVVIQRLCASPMLPTGAEGRKRPDVGCKTPDQIIRKLAEDNKLLAGGAELGRVCRPLEIAESTWHRWVTQYGGVDASDAKRTKELETENVQQLKKLLAGPSSRRRFSRSLRREASDLDSSTAGMLQPRFGVSQRRACTVIGQHRSTQGLIPPTPRTRRPPCSMAARLLRSSG